MDHAKNFKMRMQRKDYFFDLQNILYENFLTTNLPAGRQGLTKSR